MGNTNSTEKDKSTNKYIKGLEEQNEELIEIIQKMKESPEEDNHSGNSAINKAIIRKYINEMLEDDGANVAWIPDFVEKKIYENIFMLFLGLLENNIQQTSIEILGHKVKLNLEKPSN